MILLSAYTAPAGYRVNLAAHIVQMRRQPHLLRYRELAEAVQWVADARYGQRIWVDAERLRLWIVRHFEFAVGCAYSRRRVVPEALWQTTAGGLDPGLT